MIVEILLVGVSALMLLLSLIVMGLVSMTLGMGPPLVLQRFPAAPVTPPPPPAALSAARARSPYTHRAVMRARKHPWRVNLKRLERWRPPLPPDDDGRSDSEVAARRDAAKLAA